MRVVSCPVYCCSVMVAYAVIFVLTNGLALLLLGPVFVVLSDNYYDCSLYSIYEIFIIRMVMHGKWVN